MEGPCHSRCRRLFWQCHTPLIPPRVSKMGAVHTHAALWCSPGSARDDAIRAEMPHCDDVPPHLATFYDHLRDLTYRTQRHARCRPEHCFTGPHRRRLKHCKYGFPSEKDSLRRLDDSNARRLYPLRENEDSLVAEHNLVSKILFGSHVCDKHTPSDGWKMYLVTYMCKPEPIFCVACPRHQTLDCRILFQVPCCW